MTRPWRTSNADVARLAGGRRVGDPDRVAAAAFASSRVCERRQRSVGHRRAVLRIGAQPGADGDRQPLAWPRTGGSGRRARSGRARATGSRSTTVVGRRDDEELVGTVAAQDDRVRRAGAGAARRPRAGPASPAGVAVVVVEQPEVVDVDEGDAERPAGRRGRARCSPARCADERAMVQRRRSAGRAGRTRAAAAVWRVSRPWADAEDQDSRIAAMIAAVSVTSTTSRRTPSSRARIGTASRQIADDGADLATGA